MTDISDSAKKDLISAFKEVEEDDDFLVAKEAESQPEEYISPEDKYVITSLMLGSNI